MYTTPSKLRRYTYPPFDERLDPLYATHGAVRFIKLCRHYFKKSWPLAITSYNQGPGRVLKQMRRAGTKALGRIIRRRRTFGYDGRNFYTKFVASALLLKQHKKFFPEISKLSVIRYRKYVLKHPIWPTELMEITGISQKQLLLFNPSLHKLKYTDRYPIPAFFTLRIPSSSFQKFKKGLQKIRKNGGSQLRYVLKRKSKARSLAAYFNIPFTQLVRSNTALLPSELVKAIPKDKLCQLYDRKLNRKLGKKLRWKHKKACRKLGYKRLAANTTLMIPAKRRAATGRYIGSYRVRGNEPLAWLACYHCTTIWHLRYLNPSLSFGRMRAGTRLKVPVCTRSRRRAYRKCHQHHYSYRRAVKSRRRLRRKRHKKRSKKSRWRRSRVRRTN